MLSPCRQGSGCEKVISHLTEMISAAFYTFEHGDSDSKIGPKTLLQCHVTDDVSNVIRISNLFKFRI